jgi:hypothetical protein
MFQKWGKRNGDSWNHHQRMYFLCNMRLFIILLRVRWIEARLQLWNLSTRTTVTDWSYISVSFQVCRSLKIIRLSAFRHIPQILLFTFYLSLHQPLPNTYGCLTLLCHSFQNSCIIQGCTDSLLTWVQIHCCVLEPVSNYSWHMSLQNS